MDASKSRFTALAVFLVVVLGVGFTIGLTIRPGDWYVSLDKPFFTPASWLFAPVWTAVYILIAVAGWRVAITEGFRSASFGLWCLQMLLNWAWTPTFFGLHLILPGFIILLLLLIVAAAFAKRATDRVASWCFVPYLAWLAYASALNAAIAFFN